MKANLVKKWASKTFFLMEEVPNLNKEWNQREPWAPIEWKINPAPNAVTCVIGDTQS